MHSKTSFTNKTLKRDQKSVMGDMTVFIFTTSKRGIFARGPEPQELLVRAAQYHII